MKVLTERWIIQPAYPYRTVLHDHFLLVIVIAVDVDVMLGISVLGSAQVKEESHFLSILCTLVSSLYDCFETYLDIVGPHLPWRGLCDTQLPKHSRPLPRVPVLQLPSSPTDTPPPLPNWQTYTPSKFMPFLSFYHGDYPPRCFWDTAVVN